MTSTTPTSKPVSAPDFDPVPLIARELALPQAGVAAVARLLGEGSTVPFIARYRKEVTGGLDEVQIRTIEERHAYLGELDKRRRSILESIEEQGKLTPQLRAALEKCESKAELEDLYLPFKPRRRTRATAARERGLEPLAERILAQPDAGDPRAEAAAFVDPEKEVPDADAALAGASDIVAEVLAERADVRGFVREVFLAEGVLACQPVAEKTEGQRTKFEQYYEHAEKVATMPSHRFLAIRRGEREGVLRASIEIDVERVVAKILALAGHRAASPFGPLLLAATEDAYKRLLAGSIESDVRVELKLRADREAVDVFALNLRNLLLAAPLGQRPVVGVDPGLRTGCKVAAVDPTGKFLDDVTVYPFTGDKQEKAARKQLGEYLARHRPAAVAVGNGTAGRETEAFVRDVLGGLALGDEAPIVVLVSEAGASVYSASDIAREEFPELDLTVRGAISIARRLQDPLAELVKIDPKSIGVGQYQHDVHQPLLKRKLDEVVESCVNHVGVELNTASAPLLGNVAGIGPALAKKIVAHREAHGAFASRKALLEVGGLGPRTFEQCAGFLRVKAPSAHALDASAVHPERYRLVERIAKDLGAELPALVGNATLVERIDIARYVSDEVGEPTLRDIIDELKKPGRDPRDSFEPPKFRDDVRTLNDLKPGMTLNGVVTNVTHFGAFVDIGVKQDGLVHISQLADRFVRDAAEVVSVGDSVVVRVLEVDLERGRISLTCRSEAAAKPEPRRDGERAAGGGERGGERRGGGGKGGRGPGRGEGRDRRPDKRGGDNRGQGGQRPPRGGGGGNNNGSGSGDALTHNPFADLLGK